jgi:hypothetical protein
MNINDEIWSKIKGLEHTKYIISNFGNIKNTETNYMLEKNYKSGYPTVLLTHKNISKTYKVHVLVAKTFLPNNNPKLVINHIDGDKKNSKVSNLEWITHSENIKHAYNTGLLVVPKKDNNEKNTNDEKDFLQHTSKKIDNYPNYSVTTTGKVYSHKTKKYIKEHTNNEGYLRLGLYNNDGEKKYLVHQLVAKTFIPNPSNKSQVNHIDSNKSNNCVKNLEWVTNQENRNHSLRQYKTLNILPDDFSFDNFSAIKKNIIKAKIEINILKKDLNEEILKVAQLVKILEINNSI